MNPAVDLKRTSVQPEGPSLSDCILQVSPAKQLPNLARLPHLIVTTQASFHAVYDYCTVRYLQEAGVPVDFLDLPKARIYGNAHFMFLEKNNLVIAAEVERWMKSKLYASTNVSWA